MELNFTAEIDYRLGSWRGTAVIPSDYFPPNVVKFNAFAIHGKKGKTKRV